MAEESRLPDNPDIAAPLIRSRRWAPSLVWVVPIAAAVVGLSVAFDAWRTAGPRITIGFQTAEGLEVGKTLVKYRNVTIGRVTAIRLNPNHSSVLVTADLARSAQDVATADTQFWVVRPRFGVGWASGLDTLLSGAFVGVETGESNKPRRDFTGLEIPPPLSHGAQGKLIALHAQDLGSVSLGAPVYFRRLQVGRVIDERFEPDGSGARLDLFIDAPNDRFVTQSTRFWNASGIDISIGANGLNLKTQSLVSVLAGGIAFDTAPAVQKLLPAPSGAQFILYKDEAAAMAPPDGEPHYVRMRFEQSLRGLSIGAPVEFVGVSIGRVVSIDLDYNKTNQSFPVIVTAVLYPRRMGRAYEVLAQQGTAESDDKMAHLVEKLVARGLRAQPRPGDLLTGQLYLALDFVPGARTARFNAAARPLEIPTIRGSINELQVRIASIVGKLDDLPLNAIARHLDADLTSIHGTLNHFDDDIVPSAAATFNSAHDTLGEFDRFLADDSPWRSSLEDTLIEARRTMRSVRTLTELLERHPEALIRGRHAPVPSDDVSARVGDSAP